MLGAQEKARREAGLDPGGKLNQFLRRRITPIPARPRPNRASEAGSGTVEETPVALIMKVPGSTELAMLKGVEVEPHIQLSAPVPVKSARAGSPKPKTVAPTKKLPVTRVSVMSNSLKTLVPQLLIVPTSDVNKTASAGLPSLLGSLQSLTVTLWPPWSKPPLWLPNAI